MNDVPFDLAFIHYSNLRMIHVCALDTIAQHFLIHALDCCAGWVCAIHKHYSSMVWTNIPWVSFRLML